MLVWVSSSRSPEEGDEGSIPAQQHRGWASGKGGGPLLLTSPCHPGQHLAYSWTQVPILCKVNIAHTLLPGSHFFPRQWSPSPAPDTLGSLQFPKPWCHFPPRALHLWSSSSGQGTQLMHTSFCPQAAALERPSPPPIYSAFVPLNSLS